MGFLDSIFRRKGAEAAPPEDQPAVTKECPHAALVPHWGSAADMGKSALVSSYVCESCGGSFSREEGERMGVAAAERLRVSEDQRQDRMGH